MKISRRQRIFGVGPLGAVLSLLLLAALMGLDLLVGQPVITNRPGILYMAAWVLILFGAGLHVWSFMTLRNWWQNDHLCTQGPFRYVRHPMYTAWISLIVSGGVLLCNSWIMLAGPPALHLLWHRLVPREEAMMAAVFGDVYLTYAARTGRFLPRG